MSLRFASEQLADLRHDALLVIERAGDQEGELEALVAATEGDLTHAEAAVSHAAVDLDVSDVRHRPSGQRERSAAGAATRDARVIAYTGNPSFDNSPTRTLFAAVLNKAGNSCAERGDALALLPVDMLGNGSEAVLV